MSLRHSSRRVATSVTVFALLVLSGCSQDLPLNTLDPQGKAGKYIDRLVNPVFAVAGLVFIFVNAGVLYVAIKYRRKDGEDDVFPPQIHGNTKLELGWTILPALVLAVVSVGTLFTLFKLTSTPSNPAVTVRVEGPRNTVTYAQAMLK